MNDGAKPLEIELKLLVAGTEAEQATVACLREDGYRVDELEPVRNVDTYLDTFDWSLFKNGLALRYRLANGSATYTLKSIEAIEGGIAQRTETIVRLDAPIDTPAEVPVKELRKLLGRMIFPRKLLEHVRITTDRRRYKVATPEEGKIELAFDTSSLALRGLHKPRPARKLNELEAELLQGSTTALESLAAILAKRFNYPPSRASKLEAAIERLKVALPSKNPPPELRVGPDDRVDLAVRKFLTYQFQRLTEQLPGLHLDIDTEFLHQARVATRRMRSALRLFHQAVPEKTADYLEAELKWLAGLFGAVRDLDVFVLNLSRFKKSISQFPATAKAALEAWLATHRSGPLGILREALDSARYRGFERRLMQFLQRPLAPRPKVLLALKKVRDVAPVLVAGKLEAVLTRGQAMLANPKPQRRHALRIQMKKLRYVSEFMAPAYDGGLDPFIKQMAAIQDCLGEMQDTVYTRAFIEQLRDDWKGTLVDPTLLFVLGEIYQLQANIERKQRGKLRIAWARFASEETVALFRGLLAEIATRASSMSAACREDEHEDRIG
ncbi:MAG: CHAD domain-containing protein [Planctomycetota bacterium]